MMSLYDHDITRYPDHRPERALLQWCDAIACRDFLQAAALSTRFVGDIDRRSIPQALRDVQHQGYVKWWGPMVLQHVEITDVSFVPSKVERGVAVADITVIMQTAGRRIGRDPLAHRPEHIRIRMIREAPDGQPDVRGEWKLNPYSFSPADEEVSA